MWVDMDAERVFMARELIVDSEKAVGVSSVV